MKVEINKNQDGTFTLEIQSGHFIGKLYSISSGAIKDLSTKLNEISSDNSPSLHMVWNPRAGRHELVKTE